MVDEDPDIEEYYWKERNSAFYNVTFLDENVTRAWISSKNLCPFWRPPRNEHKLKDQKRKYSSAIMKAEEKAKIAVKMTFKERLQKYSFVHLYKGKWPLAKDDESEDDVRDMTDILLDEVNDLDSLLSFNSDIPDNSAMLEKKKDLHEECPTMLSGIINSIENRMNMDASISVADINNHKVSSTDKNQSSMKSSALGKKDSKYIKNKCPQNIIKSKKIHPPLEKNKKSIKRIKKSKVVGTENDSATNETTNNTETNKKDNKFNDLKDSSECRKNSDASNKTSDMQNDDYMEIVEQELDKNLIIRDENSKCETLTENNPQIFSETSQLKHVDNLSKSIEWVVNEYKCNNNIDTEKKVISDCVSTVSKKINCLDKFKFLKKVSNINDEEKKFPCPSAKTLTNSDVNNNKRKKKLEESLSNNTNSLKKKIKPSFKCVKPSFKAIKNQSSLENLKQFQKNGKYEESQIFTAISKFPDKKINSNNCITANLGNTSVSNGIEINSAMDGREFKCETINSDLIMNHSDTLNNHCAASPELPDSETNFDKENVLVSNTLTDKKINLTNLDKKNETFKKDSETVVNGAIKSKTVKVHKKIKPENKIENSNDTDSKCIKSHDSFNLIKACENFVTESKIDTVSDDSSRHSCVASSPSQIKVSDDGFFDISLSEEELDI